MFPIFIPIRTQRIREGKDHKCPKCNHEWDDEYKPMSLFSKIILTIIVSIVVVFIAGLFECSNGGVIYNRLLVRTVHNYDLPSDWDLFANKKGQYLVKHKGMYLTRAANRKLTLEEFSDIYTPLKFNSEERAKSTVKYYIENSTNSRFKEVNDVK